MDIGDKVKLVKGNPFGKVGIIIFKMPTQQTQRNTQDRYCSSGQTFCRINNKGPQHIKSAKQG